MTTTAIRITGDKEIVRRFEKVAHMFKRSSINKVLSKAATGIKRAVVSHAPIGPTGTLKRSIKKKTLRGNPPAVSVRSDFRIAPHTHLVVTGTVERFHKASKVSIGRLEISTKGKSVGAMPVNPFVERGLNAGASAAARSVTEGLKQLLRDAGV